MFNQDVIAAVREAKFCRVVIYPVIRGWSGERVLLEVSDDIAALGCTDCQRGQGIGWYRVRRQSKWRRRPNA